MKHSVCIYLCTIYGMLLATTSITLSAGELGSIAKRGEVVYEENCSGCHQPNGEGMANTFPKLVGAAVVVGTPKNLIEVVIRGRGISMPPVPPKMSDSDIAAVINFIRTSWGNSAALVTTTEIASVRATTN
jgi:mono/diheme cytochrome c family protein